MMTRSRETPWRIGVPALAVALALTILTAAPGRVDAGEAGLDEIEVMLMQWREPEAAAALALLEARGVSRGPRYLGLKGAVLFRQGEYDAALRSLAEAERIKPGQRGVARLLKRAAAVRDLTRGYTRQRSRKGHFIIATPPGKDELLAPFAGETLEAVRAALKADLGYAPPDPIRVEVYPSAEALARVSALTVADISRTGTIALCKFNRLMIVTPRSLLRGYAWRDTLAHEYAHLIISRVSHNGAPIWLHEGLAKHFEARWRSPSGGSPPLVPSQEHLLGEALRKGKLLSWASMHPSMAKLPNQRAAALAFAQVQTAVDLLADTIGTAGLRRILGLMRDPRQDGWKALTRVSGLSQEAFTTAWRKHLRGLSLRALPDLEPPTLELGKAPTQEQRLARVPHEKARGYLRLASLLRSRKRTRAAIVEYQKARALLGPREEYVANHLARAYLEVSSPAQAISALLPVLEYYPELPGPQVTMGVAYLRKGGDMQAAARHLEVGLRLNPFSPEVHCGLATALAKIDPPRATRHAKICKQLKTR